MDEVQPYLRVQHEMAMEVGEVEGSMFTAGRV